MKRWVAAVAAIGLAAVGGIAAQAPARASSTAWYQVYQASKVSGGFNQVAALSKRNIWAVGNATTSTGKTIYTPFIRHFNGSTWQKVVIPGGSGFTTDWVTASASNNVWVGGRRNASVATVIYRWNGAKWAKIPLPAMTALGGVVALAPNNVWAYGVSGTVDYDIFHWNGTKWHYYMSNATRFVPQGISASAANNVWLSGYGFSGSKDVVAAYKWNGRAWHAVSTPHPAIYCCDNVTAVSPSNVWIGYDAANNEFALHWNGKAWRAITGSYYADTGDIVPDGKGGYWFGAMTRLDGSTWTDETVPGFTGSFGGVTRIPGTTSFLIAASVLTGKPATQKPTLFRFDLLRQWPPSGSHDRGAAGGFRQIKSPHIGRASEDPGRHDRHRWWRHYPQRSASAGCGGSTDSRRAPAVRLLERPGWSPPGKKGQSSRTGACSASAKPRTRSGDKNCSAGCQAAAAGSIGPYFQVRPFQ